MGQTYVIPSYVGSCQAFGACFIAGRDWRNVMNGSPDYSHFAADGCFPTNEVGAEEVFTRCALIVLPPLPCVMYTLPMQSLAKKSADASFSLTLPSSLSLLALHMYAAPSQHMLLYCFLLST